ncbi:hypothetical protein Leryth_013251 [Lithospermum erythrorhizon]|nr:hypothetical protein Leryth_013251 [Lithospermum erythrorhizon]
MEGEILKEDKLPPGFRFHPTDEELVTYYLVRKISDSKFVARAVTDVDLNKCEPWDLPAKAKMGEKEWYFFSLRDRKYPTGVRTNRATNTGYWKTTGKDKEIYNSTTSELVGMKKTLVFYRGRAPRGEKTNWVMHEYRIHPKSSYRTTAKDEWVVCRVFQKSVGLKKYPPNTSSSTSRQTIPTYNNNLDNHFGTSSGAIFPPQMIMQPHDNILHHQLMNPMIGRNNISYADLQEFTKVFRGGPSGANMNFHPMQTQQANYGENCFTISGLNLNLSGGMQSSNHQTLRPIMTQQDVNAAMMNNIAIQQNQAVAASYASGAEMNNNNANSMGNRFGQMEHCSELESYWPSF